MNVARIAVLGVALVAGVGAALLASGRNAEPEVVTVEKQIQISTEQVLVVAEDISLGSQTEESTYKWQSWPEEIIQAGFITRSDRPDAIEELAGAVVRVSMLEGEPVSERKLIQSDNGIMSAILPQGMRAVATEISAATSAGGFILPNDRVDVILTRSQDGDRDGYVAETILTNIRVLAIDQLIEEKSGGSVVVGSTATLELNPRQVEVLTLAERMGDLSLSLRSIEDAQAASTAKAEGGGVTVVRYGLTKQVTTRQ